MTDTNTYPLVEFVIWAESELSDLYKDVNGIRPRGLYPFAMPKTEFRKEWNRLCDRLEVVMDEEAARQAEAKAEFEASIQKVIEAGAGDRETAFRWLLDGVEVEYTQELDYFLWNQGLGYKDCNTYIAEIKYYFFGEIKEVA